MDSYLIAALVAVVAVLGAVATRALRLRTRVRQLEERFAPVLNIEEEAATVGKVRDELRDSVDELRASYAEKKAIFDRLVVEAAIYDEEIQLAELGFYKPHFEFATPQEYKDKIAAVRSEQKRMMSSKSAVVCGKEWTVEGSRAKGRTMTNRGIRLTARAFNNECDAAVSSVSWNNVQRMEHRIQKAFDAINKLNESNEIAIVDDYLDLKIQELQLTYEYRQKRQDEKEEQAEIRRRMREEAKLQQEAEKAASDERKYEQLLDKAKREAVGATAGKLESLQAKVAALTADLESARERSERAVSMAEQTKSGHVYVISNVGSFGENVYKIGMTRRLDPTDRVRELGDASVPFVFDTHAMVYAEDAPALESALHKRFQAQQLNLVNSRKEFFRVGLDEVREEVLKFSPEAEVVEVGEAQEYRETLALREELATASSADADPFPDEI